MHFALRIIFFKPCIMRIPSSCTGEEDGWGSSGAPEEGVNNFFDVAKGEIMKCICESSSSPISGGSLERAIQSLPPEDEYIPQEWLNRNSSEYNEE